MAPIPKKFNIRILIHLYINQGTVVIVQKKIPLTFIQKLINVPLRLFRTLEYLHRWALNFLLLTVCSNQK